MANRAPQPSCGKTADQVVAHRADLTITQAQGA